MSRVVEIATTGIDEQLQNLSGDPFGGSTSVGLRVPTLATPDKDSRYLFLGASFSLGEGHHAKILGWRELATLGAVTTAASEEGPERFVEMEITSPTFRLPDGNISYHLHRLGPPNARGWPQIPASNTTDLRSFVRRWADGPALLYESYTIPAGNQFYVDITSYTPPNRGQPWGEPVGQLGTMYDLRTPWREDMSWHALGIEVEGPGTFAMFISVRQGAGVSGVTPAVGVGFPSCMCEEQFLAAFPGAIYWRVGCSLVVDFEAKI